MKHLHFKNTEYGFEWGAAKITRIAQDEDTGRVVIGLETPKYKGHDNIQIYVSKTGKVKVHKLEKVTFHKLKKQGIARPCAD